DLSLGSFQSSQPFLQVQLVLSTIVVEHALDSSPGEGCHKIRKISFWSSSFLTKYRSFQTSSPNTQKIGPDKTFFTKFRHSFTLTSGPDAKSADSVPGFDLEKSQRQKPGTIFSFLFVESGLNV